MAENITNIPIIDIKNLTKKYKNDKGIFDVNLQVKSGEIFGFLGPNGAGKTTTIRHILGFQKQDAGTVEVFGINSWRQPQEINFRLGYVPGEIVFPNSGTGWSFIKNMAKFKELDDLTFAKELINRFQFNPNVKLKAMSKGMKQKVAIVVAFMNKPKTLILDEPTSGLDPLMQLEFDKLLLEFKRDGCTILLSSHIFSEIEKVCDRVTIIKAGRIVTSLNLADVRHTSNKKFKIEFNDSKSFEKAKIDFKRSKKFELSFENLKNLQMYVSFDDKNINEFIDILSQFDVKFINQQTETLEEHFMKYYTNGEKFSFRDIKKGIIG